MLCSMLRNGTISLARYCRVQGGLCSPGTLLLGLDDNASIIIHAYCTVSCVVEIESQHSLQSAKWREKHANKH